MICVALRAGVGSPAAMNRRIATTIFLLLAVLAVFALSGCGESKEDKALASVCTSKADIEKQVNTLKSLVVSPETTDQMQKAATAIAKDLQAIEAQMPALKSSVRSQVQAANAKFKSDLASISLEIADSISVKDGKVQASKSYAELEDAYKQAYSSLKCP